MDSALRSVFLNKTSSNKLDKTMVNGGPQQIKL